MYRVCLSIGSNIGNRFINIATAISRLCKSNCEVINSSFLRETYPMHIINQPKFLNVAIEIKTDLEPQRLLNFLKDIEKSLGRNMNGIRYGPRPVDLDIVFYGTNDGGNDIIFNSKELTIPHPRCHERSFVLEPLCDIDPSMVHPTKGKSVQSLLKDCDYSDPAVRLIPLPRNRFLSSKSAHVMGILNVTPDSFSDGGQLSSVDDAVKTALKLIDDGASIIDIGGESTRPGAEEIILEEQLCRTIPVIESLRLENSDIPISIDTRHSHVAKEAINAGADLVNDVSGGEFDSNMFSVVSELKIPIVLMHMRGTPRTMQTMTDYDNVLQNVSSHLLLLSQKAQKKGIHKWSHIYDPGIGFAKDYEHNLLLLKHYNELRINLFNPPMLIGTSRKGFIGKILSELDPQQRDFGTVASVLSALLSANHQQQKVPIDNNKFDIVRVHNVKAMKQALLIMETINNH